MAKKKCPKTRKNTPEERLFCYSYLGEASEVPSICVRVRETCVHLPGRHGVYKPVTHFLQPTQLLEFLAPRVFQVNTI